MIEDVAADVVLINHELRRGGLMFRSKRVDNRQDFVRELQHTPPDVILSDHGLASFDGFTALAMARDLRPDIPFIFVTGSIGEELVADTLKAGAVDFVLKDRLATNLVPAVQRALRKAEAERQKHDAEYERELHLRELEAALAKFKALSATLPICACCKRKVRDTQGIWRPLEEYVESPGRMQTGEVICPDCTRGRTSKRTGQSGAGGGGPWWPTAAGP